MRASIVEVYNENIRLASTHVRFVLNGSFESAATYSGLIRFTLALAIAVAAMALENQSRRLGQLFVCSFFGDELSCRLIFDTGRLHLRPLRVLQKSCFLVRLGL